MEEFQLFDKILDEIQGSNTDKDKLEEFIEDECHHTQTVIEDGTEFCTECGEEINKKNIFGKESQYFGVTDIKHNFDPSRVQSRKVDERTIYKDVENMGFSEKIINTANQIYLDVTSQTDKNSKIYRGNSRKAIIFACIFHAYKYHGHPQSYDTLISSFKITRKIGLKGIKYISNNISKQSPIRTLYITPANLMDDIMDKFDASQIQKKEVLDLYEKIKDRSSKLNRSRPQSVASAVVYHWIKHNNRNITMKDFVKKVQLSELTVNKIVKEIDTILGIN